MSENEETREFTPEELAEIEEFYNSMLRKRFKNRITNIKKYLTEYNISLDEAIAEIQSKTSKLSAMNRDFLLTFNKDVLDKWLQ